MTQPYSEAVDGGREWNVIEREDGRIETWGITQPTPRNLGMIRVKEVEPFVMNRISWWNRVRWRLWMRFRHKRGVNEGTTKADNA